MPSPPPPPGAPGLNPRLRQESDPTYSEAQNGSDPMATVSVKKAGPAVWPVIWAAVAIALVVFTVWLLI